MEKEVVKKEVVKMEKLLKSLLIVFVIATGFLAGVTVEPLLQGKPTAAITVDNAMLVGVILAAIMTYLGGLLMGSVVEEDTGISATQRFLLFLSIIGILSFLIGMKIPTL